MPYQSLHVSMRGMTLEVPQKYIDKFDYVVSDVRRRLAAMANNMDESIGVIIERLHSRGMLDNSVVIFVSDNGGDPLQHVGNGGSNYPLRGTKLGLFEGGIRVPAFIWSPLLNKSGYVSNALIHVTDLLPTILDAINGTGIRNESNIYVITN
ncbi:unnamed protein product [Oppiella nova]|uniref:Sulfatase N-terminal domain-containing protein n=1 Tax=Oppiella nova TaxID=334625 RepID=A0A7R9MPW6_9ACAR|nr:unnamed protein product [Oppiella nova]CAG2181449.1 unnamed protein product [Oppiella nova]